MPVLFGRATDHPRQKRRSLRALTASDILGRDPEQPMLDDTDGEDDIVSIVASGARDRSPRLAEESVH